METLDEHIYFSINTSARLLSRLSDEYFKPYGFSSSYAFIIIAISRNGKSRQKEICEYFDLAPSTVTRFADKLIKQDLIEKNLDGKEVVLSLTENGTHVAQKLEDELIVLNSAIRQKLGDKYSDTLNRMLQHASEMLK